MKFEIAKKLAESNQLNSEHKQSIKKTIHWLNQKRHEEIQRYNIQIAKWKQLIENKENIKH